jgi:hypothetical protein
LGFAEFNPDESADGLEAFLVPEVCRYDLSIRSQDQQ